MATEGHDLDMIKAFAPLRRHWHSVKMLYVSARVDNTTVATIDRRSRATLSEPEARTETINDSSTASQWISAAKIKMKDNKQLTRTFGVRPRERR